MKTWVKTVLVSIGVFIILAGAIWAWRYFTAPIEGRVGAQEQIFSSENIIVAYNHFYNLQASITALDATIIFLEEQLEQTTSEDEQERIRATITGVKAQRARAIAQYNADAKKSYTIGQFRAWDLPYQIEEE